MKFGMPTLIEFNSIEENIELAKALNLDFIELNLDLPYCNLPGTELLDLSNKYNIEFTAHLSEKLDVAELDNDLRLAYLNKIEKIIRWGTSNNITKYNLHLDPGIHFSLPDKKIFIYEKYIDKYKQALTDSCSHLSKIAEKYNIEIMFENLKSFDYLLNGFKIISSYNNLYFTLDMGHDIRNGNNIQAFFEHYPSKIKHVHLHDFNGKSDHLELGTGIVNIEEKIDFIEKYNTYTVIEVKRKEDLINSVHYINNIMKTKKERNKYDNKRI